MLADESKAQSISPKSMGTAKKDLKQFSSQSE